MRTTLALALLRPAEDLLAYASVGDSHVFRVDAERTAELAVARGRPVAFLGFDAETPKSLGGKCVVRTAVLEGAGAVALATDGLSERGIGVDDPASAVADAVRSALSLARDLRPGAAARGIVERALDAQRRHRAGDNVASAVFIIG